MKKMHAMVVKLMFTQIVDEKLVKNQRIDSSEICASMSDDNITLIWNVIQSDGGFVKGRVLEKRNKISIKEAKNLQLVAIAFKMMEHCFK